MKIGGEMAEIQLFVLVVTTFLTKIVVTNKHKKLDGPQLPPPQLKDGRHVPLNSGALNTRAPQFARRNLSQS